mgnify:CR=1 FL=1
MLKVQKFHYYIGMHSLYLILFHWIEFLDETNGKQTYGGGRFLYVNPPDNNGNVLINFNKSYNPPCVFSSFTTCPLPSAFNTLSIPINAGEKMYNGKLYSSIYQ